MRQTFVFERVAVVVGPWREPGEPSERGARVEVRFVTAEPHRGSPFAAQRIVVDEPLFRADLFDRDDEPPGNLLAAHCHSGFDGVEPRPREWPAAIQRDPLGWLRAELGDLRQLLTRSGVETGDAEWIEADAGALQDARDAIVSAVEATWESVRRPRARTS